MTTSISDPGLAPAALDTAAGSQTYPTPPAGDPFLGRTWAWRSGPCRAAAHAFEILCEPPGMAAFLEPIVASLRVRGTVSRAHRYGVLATEGGAPFELYVDDVRLRVAAEPAALVRFLVWHVNRAMVTTMSATHAVFHAAAAVRAGVTVLLPGDQERGKTTTVAGLLAEGYDYVTDEAAAVDPATLEVTVFPKALSLDQGSPVLPAGCGLPAQRSGSTADGQWQVPAEQLGGRVATGPAHPPRLVVFPHYVAGARTAATPVGPAQAAKGLALCSFHFYENARRNLRVAADLARSAHAVDLRIGDLDDAVEAVELLVSELLMREL